VKEHEPDRPGPEANGSHAAPALRAHTSGTRLPVKLHRRVCLVLTEDAVLAEELLASKRLAADVVGRLTDRALLVRPGRVEAVLQELQRMGHTPSVVSNA
jgi:hypothetical protein